MGKLKVVSMIFIGLGAGLIILGAVLLFSRERSEAGVILAGGVGLILASSPLYLASRGRRD